jgi:V-type H+-transporting ATPase subunit C
MKVGTLDTLMSLSDELSKADTYVEGVVRKVERQLADATAAVQLAAAMKNAKPGSNPPAAQSMAFKVGDTPVHEYVKRFKWDSEAYDPREALPDLVKRLVAAAEKVGWHCECLRHVICWLCLCRSTKISALTAPHIKRKRRPS